MIIEIGIRKERIDLVKLQYNNFSVFNPREEFIEALDSIISESSDRAYNTFALGPYRLEYYLKKISKDEGLIERAFICYAITLKGLVLDSLLKFIITDFLDTYTIDEILIEDKQYFKEFTNILQEIIKKYLKKEHKFPMDLIVENAKTKELIRLNAEEHYKVDWIIKSIILKLFGIVGADDQSYRLYFEGFPLKRDATMSEISGLKNYTKLILKRKPSKEALIFFSYSLKDSNKFQINYLTKEISRYDSVKQILYCEADTEHDFVKYMDDFIGKCDLVLLLCSYNSLKSTLVVDEWTAAYAMKKPIILIYHRLEYIPPLLCSKIGIKFDKNNIQKIAKEVHKNILKLFPEE